MISVNEQLPETDGLTSRAILFVVDGQRYCGHYHRNGWFYCDEHKPLVRMAYGPQVKAQGSGSHQPVTSWEYLREAVSAEPTELELMIQHEKDQRTSFFKVGDIVSPTCASLDLLTPMHKHRYESLSEGEQILLFEIVSNLANHPLGDWFTSTKLPLNARQSTRAHIASVLARLVAKKVLIKLDQKFRMMNPGFELWMRMRSLQIAGYNDLATKICPILLHDDEISPSDFWTQLCHEAGVYPQIKPSRKFPPYI